MFDRIVLLTDLSDVTRLAFGPLASIANAFASKVTIFHAYRGSSELFYLEGDAAKMRALIDEADHNRALPTLQAYQQELAGMGVEAEIVTRVGSFFDLSIDVLHELDADLAVIATQGLNDFTGRVISSATARIIRDTKVPLLTVNERFADRSTTWEGFAHIVTPVDFSTPWEGQLRAAENFAVEIGGSVEVVHVVAPLQDQTLTTPEGDILVPKDLQYQLRKRLMTRLSDVAHSVQRAPAFWKLIEDNKAGSGVMSWADRSGADLIVVPAIGRDQTRNALLGSAAEHVIKHARCPVLTLQDGWAPKA
jgi:nucleotide-binding universal stress UspA family protein